MANVAGGLSFMMMMTSTCSYLSTSSLQRPYCLIHFPYQISPQTTTLPSIPFTNNTNTIKALGSSLFMGLSTPINKFKIFRVLDSAVTSTQVVEEDLDQSSKEVEDSNPAAEQRPPPCQLYICNLPRSCDTSELLEMFKPYGTVQSVEVSRNEETGLSRGCSYITMGSIDEAKAAVVALDGFDVDGREMRVKFSSDMIISKNLVAAAEKKKKKKKKENTAVIFESPHKIYVGNLSWSIKPEELRNHFSKFGTVVSTRILYDRKAGKNRVYGFLSFSSVNECEAAVSNSNGTELHGRTMTVRQVLQTSET